MLRDTIDFDLVIDRLGILGEFERSTFGVSLSAFLPELDEVYDAVRKKVFACPNSVEKAEAWLRISFSLETERAPLFVLAQNCAFPNLTDNDDKRHRGDAH